LQKRRRHHADEKRGQPVTERDMEKPAKIGSEGAGDAAAHHMHTPEQQRDAAHEVEEN
jgi:hypothetical protein